MYACTHSSLVVEKEEKSGANQWKALVMSHRTKTFLCSRLLETLRLNRGTWLLIHRARWLWSIYFFFPSARILFFPFSVAVNNTVPLSVVWHSIRSYKCRELQTKWKNNVTLYCITLFLKDLTFSRPFRDHTFLSIFYFFIASTIC